MWQIWKKARGRIGIKHTLALPEDEQGCEDKIELLCLGYVNPSPMRNPEGYRDLRQDHKGGGALAIKRQVDNSY